MGLANKFLALTFSFLVLSCLVMFSTSFSNVYAVDKPDVPQFSVKIIDNSYNIPPSTTTTVDPYTGKETTYTNSGNQVTDRSIEFTIKNQPFTPYKDANNYRHVLRYRIQFKGHYEEDWKDLLNSNWRIIPSDTEYTVVTSTSDSIYAININSLAVGSQLDFRVQAVDGYLKPLSTDHGGPLGEAFIDDLTSSWSNINTVTIPGKSSSSSPSQTNPPTNPPATSDNNRPQQSEQNQLSDFMSHPLFLLGVGALVGVGVTVAVLMFTRQRMKTLDYNNSSLTN
jgi:hypothetical protein